MIVRRGVRPAVAQEGPEMNLTAFALLAATTGVAQPASPAPADARFVAKRSLSVPVQFNPERLNDLEKARLFVSRDGGHTYELHQQITAKETGFTFTAKEDGTYWVQMQLQFRDGKLDPKNPSAVPPAEKLIIDTVKPVVTIGTAEQAGEEIQIDWQIDDKHPADPTTKVFYKPTTGDNGSWKEVPATAMRKRSARFKPEVPGPLVVQVATADLAGNIGAANREVGAKTASGFTPTGGMGGPLPAPGGLADAAPSPSNGFGGSAPSTPLPPSDPSPSNAGVTAPPATTTTPPSQPPFTAAASDTPRPIAQGSGIGATVAVPPAAAAATELPATQYSRTPRFELNYSLDGGPSGIARVDLYVTRDDGRNWVRWSSHDGRETPLKVVLDTRFNKEVEGDYGFVLVPVSGAGLSEAAPTAGTAPDMRVRVDATAPVIKVYQPTADPNNRNALLLHWEATDRNFGRDPIAVEYSEQPTGPWRSVSGPEVVTAAATGGGKESHRIENGGSYSWQPPLTLASPKVYLKFTAWDQAGNRSEVVTPNPILVDLTKPKAKIQGISGGR
jgi:hypothetical protein